MTRFQQITCTLFTIALVLQAVFTASAVWAGSAQVEVTEPILPVPHGKSANGNASMVWVGTGKLYNSAGNIGGTFPLGTINRGQLYFLGDIFTWVENPDWTQFKPKRVFYTLEPGYNWVKAGNEIRFFIKHQSYHNVDFHFGSTESYELMGFNYRRFTNPRYALRLAKYTNTKVVDYDWDIAGSITYDLPRSFGYLAYIHGWIHHVTETGNDFGRDGFTDWAVEYGFTINHGLKIITRYEFLHDVDFYGGTDDHHIMIGPKYIW